MKPHIVPFHQDMLADAGALLAQRHRRDVAALPLLPTRFTDPDCATAAVAAVWGRANASGVAALEGDRLVGYLLGNMVFDTTWGRAGWVRLPGHALAPNQHVELARDLYAALAERWVRYGCYSHVVMVSTANAALMDAWFRLGFGVEQIHALQNIEHAEPAPEPSRFKIRRATHEDGPVLASFADLIWRQQVQSPVWAFTAPERAEEMPEFYAQEVEDEEAIIWLAFDQGRAVGFQLLYPFEEQHDALFAPAHCAELSVAATLPEARGSGVGTALTRHVLAWAKTEGFGMVETDWRSTNLLASRFWLRMGFEPVAYRLARRIDPRIAFAPVG